MVSNNSTGELMWLSEPTMIPGMCLTRWCRSYSLLQVVAGNTLYGKSVTALALRVLDDSSTAVQYGYVPRSLYVLLSSTEYKSIRYSTVHEDICEDMRTIFPLNTDVPAR